MTSRADRPAIERAFFTRASVASIALRFGTSQKSVRDVWARAKDAGRLPKVARRMTFRRNSA